MIVESWVFLKATIPNLEAVWVYNPYSGTTFFQFFLVLFQRLIAFIKGGFSLETIFSDEVQILVLIGVAASTAQLGCYLVLRRMAMLANALSHTILIGIVGAYFLTVGTLGEIAEKAHDPLNMTAVLLASLFVGLLTTFLTEFLSKTVGLPEDASIGLVFSSLFALGIILVTVLTRSAHIGTEVVMGNVDGLQLSDCKLVYLALGVNLLALFLFYKEFTITTFDQGLSRALGISPSFFNYFLMTLVSLTAISAFRAVGVLMVLAFITGPPLTARLLTHHLKRMLILAVFFGILSSMAGVALSRHFLSVYQIPLSTGGIVVCLIMVVFMVIFLLTRLLSVWGRLRW